MHDQTALRTAGIAGLYQQYPRVKTKNDAGYRGLARQFPDQVEVPPLKPKKDATSEENRSLRGTAPQAVIGTDRRRARQRRAQALASPPAVHRTARILRRDLPGDLRAGPDRAAAR